jgi:hypothetical protein
MKQHLHSQAMLAIFPIQEYFATDYSLIKEHAYKDIRRSVPGLSFTSPDDKFVKPRF